MLNRNLKGISAVEIILAAGILAIVISALAGAVIGLNRSPQQLAQHTQATNLAQLSLSAVQSIRDDNFNNLAAGSYGLSNSGNTWQFINTPDTIDNFTREIVISNIDVNTKQIDANISWTNSMGISEQVSASSIITNWRRTVTITQPPGSVDWRTPQVAAAVNVGQWQNGFATATIGSFAYITTDGNSAANDFYIYDISDATNPILQSSLDLPDNSVYITVDGNYAYISTSANNSELVVVDVSDPTNASVISSLNLSGGADANGSKKVGSNLFITRSSGNNNSTELTIIDVTNPTNPVELGGINIGANVFDVEIVDNFAYLSTSDSTGELVVVDISNSSTPNLLTSLDLSGNAPAYASDSFVFNNVLYVGRTDGRLEAINITNRANPTIANTYTAPGNITSVQFEKGGNYAFLGVGDYNQEFIVLDTQNSLAPSFLNSLNPAGLYNSLAYNPDLELVVAASDDDFRELSIIVPALNGGGSQPTGPLCTIDYVIDSQWGQGFTGTITINNISANDLSSWILEWDFTNNETITNYWNTDLVQTGSSVSASNLSYNGTINTGGSVNFGFQADKNNPGRVSPIPSENFTLNGTQCEQIQSSGPGGGGGNPNNQ